MLVDLLDFTVFTEESSKNSDSSHPEHFVRNPCSHSTLTITNSSMSAYSLLAQPLTSSLGFLHSRHSWPRV